MAAWVPKREGNNFPENAFPAGYDVDGSEIFIGKALHERDMLPGKVVPTRDACYVAYDGLEREKKNYEVLCGQTLEWVRARDGQVPRKAIQGGRTASGETLYIGRVDHHGGNCIGKVQPSKRACYFSFRGAENFYHEYEILVEREPKEDESFNIR